MKFGMFWKKAGLICIVLAALAVVGYGQTSGNQRPRATNLQVAVPSGYLGVGVQEIGADRAKALNLRETAGVEVTSVTENAPAAKAGVHVHDVILEVSGQKIENGQQFVDSIRGKVAGAKVVLTVMRNGVKQPPISAVLGSRPFEGVVIPAMPMGAITPEDLQAMIAGDAPKVGFEGEPLTPQLAEFFGVREGEGVLVRSVAAKTPAEKAGLKAGDVVVKVDGMPVASPREISGIVRLAKKMVAFTVIRDKKELTLNVELAWNRPDPFGNDAVN
jgi:serine protease Do